MFMSWECGPWSSTRACTLSALSTRSYRSRWAPLICSSQRRSPFLAPSTMDLTWTRCWRRAELVVWAFVTRARFSVSFPRNVFAALCKCFSGVFKTNYGGTLIEVHTDFKFEQNWTLQMLSTPFKENVILCTLLLS